MRVIERSGFLAAGLLLAFAAAAAADEPAGLEAAKALAAQQDVPVLVKFSSEF